MLTHDGREQAAEPAAPHVQRRENGEEPRVEALRHLQRVAGNAAVGSLMQREPAEEVDSVVRSGGSPLPDATREKMEGSFGADFSSVRVHTDSGAASSAKSVQANAYTVGEHVVFDQGKYSPGSSDGEQTLAHELTHVLQQRSGPVDGTAGPDGLKVSDPGDRFERAADETAAAVTSGGAAAPAAAGGGGVQREAMPPEEEEELQTDAVQRQAAPGVEEEEEEPLPA
jgi:hypothetical protein